MFRFETDKGRKRASEGRERGRGEEREKPQKSVQISSSKRSRVTNLLCCLCVIFSSDRIDGAIEGTVTSEMREVRGGMKEKNDEKGRRKEQRGKKEGGKEKERTHPSKVRGSRRGTDARKTSHL